MSLAKLGAEEDELERAPALSPKREKALVTTRVDLPALFTQVLEHPEGCAKCTEPLVDGVGYPLPGCGHKVLCQRCSSLLAPLGLGQNSFASWCRNCSPR